MWSNVKSYKKEIIGYVCGAMFSLLVMGIYYVFSHGLRDIHMTLLFLPGVSAALFFLFLSLCKIKVGASARYAFHFGYAGVWVYLLLKGIYTMAKTGSDWLYVFWIYAIVCFGVAIAFYFLDKKGENQVQGE